MELSGYTIEELIQMKEKIDSLIYSYSDGHDYVCSVRSFGRNWVEHLKNTYEVQRLCRQYEGDDGIVDIFTTNPNLDVYNYGNIFYINSVEDYHKWSDYVDNESILKNLEKDLDEYENSNDTSLSRIRIFEPSITREKLNEFKLQFQNREKDFIEPVRIS